MASGARHSYQPHDSIRGSSRPNSAAGASSHDIVGMQAHAEYPTAPSQHSPSVSPHDLRVSYDLLVIQCATCNSLLADTLHQGSAIHDGLDLLVVNAVIETRLIPVNEVYMATQPHDEIIRKRKRADEGCKFTRMACMQCDQIVARAYTHCPPQSEMSAVKDQISFVRTRVRLHVMGAGRGLHSEHQDPSSFRASAHKPRAVSPEYGQYSAFSHPEASTAARRLDNAQGHSASGQPPPESISHPTRSESRDRVSLIDMDKLRVVVMSLSERMDRIDGTRHQQQPESSSLSGGDHITQSTRSVDSPSAVKRVRYNSQPRSLHDKREEAEVNRSIDVTHQNTDQSPGSSRQVSGAQQALQGSPANDAPVKKRRGRPPKHSLPASAPAPAPAPAPAHADGSETLASRPVKPLPTRPVGRPSATTSPTTSTTTSRTGAAEAVLSPRPHHSPPSAVSASQSAGSARSTTTNQTSPSVLGQGEAPVVKRGPGRPRKHPIVDGSPQANRQPSAAARSPPTASGHPAVASYRELPADSTDPIS